MTTTALPQWVRYLCNGEPSPIRWRQPAVRKALRTLVPMEAECMLEKLEAIAKNPIVISDDGITRSVTVLESVCYGFNRKERTFFAALREENGSWLHVPATHSNEVIFDTFLPFRSWRRRVRFTLCAEFSHRLRSAVEASSDNHANMPEWRREAVYAEIVLLGWSKLRMGQQLRAKFRTKTLRRQIREALAIDAEVLALARAARFRSMRRQHTIGHKWLSFVWQQQAVLTRIRTQTPALLRPVAQHMYQFGVKPGSDPTRECKLWLAKHGVGKRSYRLLAHRSDRPFREVLKRFTSNQSMSALVLALRLTESGHQAVMPLPSFYRATLDQFVSTMHVERIRELLAEVPKRVFIEAQRRMRAVAGCDGACEVALEYRGILDWWEKHQPVEHLDASWQRWLALVEEEDARQRAVLAENPWCCAIEKLQTLDAEVMALDTPLALFEEGRMLRHCAYKYVDKCRDGDVRLFSAQLHHQGQLERATIGLVRVLDVWTLWDIRGACNRRMGGPWVALARHVAEAYTRAS